MAKGIELELLRDIFKDDRLHVGLAVVKRVTVADDLTNVAIECEIVPEGRTVIVTETWESVGAGSCSGDVPDPNDLLIIVMADGDADHAFSIRRLASHEEKLPTQIKDGHFVTKSKPGKKLYLGSDTKIEIGKLNSAATEPLVLGLVLTTMLTQLIAEIKSITNNLISGPLGIGNLGADVVTHPTLITQLTTINNALDTIKSTYIDTASTNIVSKIGFTERG